MIQKKKKKKTPKEKNRINDLRTPKPTTKKKNQKKKEREKEKEKEKKTWIRLVYFPQSFEFPEEEEEGCPTLDLGATEISTPSSDSVFLFC